MGRSEEIARLVRDAGGVASAAQVTEAGFLPGSISHALKSGAIDRLTRGVYRSPEVLGDEFAAVTYRWRRCVLSHGSALYLAGLSDRVPGALDATVPHGYNPRGLSREHPDVRVHRVNEDVHELGITEANPPPRRRDGEGVLRGARGGRPHLSEGLWWGRPAARPRRGRGLLQEGRRRPRESRADAHGARRRGGVQDVSGGARMTRGDASLRGKLKAMAKKCNLKLQGLLQMYLFEHLLMRLEKSDYAETFVLEGGLPISSMTGTPLVLHEQNNDA